MTGLADGADCFEAAEVPPVLPHTGAQGDQPIRPRRGPSMLGRFRPDLRKDALAGSNLRGEGLDEPDR